MSDKQYVFFYDFDVWPAKGKVVRGERKKDLFKNMEKLPFVQSGHDVFCHASEIRFSPKVF